MPLTKKAKRFMGMCAGGKAKAKCPPKATAKKLLRHSKKKG